MCVLGFFFLFFRCAFNSNFLFLFPMQGANVPTAKPGQSPFIPGPSRQILEGLMKENSDLKKTVSNLTGKVGTCTSPTMNLICIRVGSVH